MFNAEEYEATARVRVAQAVDDAQYIIDLSHASRANPPIYSATEHVVSGPVQSGPLLLLTSLPAVVAV
jgi:hypothetical protein